MTLRLVGAGLPRTGTDSLRNALATLLDAPSYHMRELPGHPYDLGPQWKTALEGGTPDWDHVFEGYAASLDWPASLFWRELADAYPDAIVLLSLRADAETWLASMEATVLPVARAIAPQDWIGGRDLALLLERFAGTTDWDHPDVLLGAHHQWLADVRRLADPARLVEWQPGDGWDPLCSALGVPVPDLPFPWSGRRQDWTY